MSDAASKKASLARSLNFEGYYNCSREEAKELFRPFVFFDGMYLVRPSESKGALYTLSVTKDEVVYNYRIQRDTKANQFSLNEQDKFPTIDALIQGHKDKPINTQLDIKLIAPVVQGTRRKQDSNGFINNYNKRQEGYGNVPGLHCFLPRSEVKKAMEPYKTMTGAFLVRPSSTDEGSLTLSIVYKDTILSFKTIQDPLTREVLIASKSFLSLEEMLDYYTKHSLKARGHESEKILLRYPIPVDKKLETIHRMAQDELYTTLAGKLPSAKPAPPSPSTKPKLKKLSIQMANEDTSTVKETLKLQETTSVPLKDNSAENLLDQALQELENFKDELNTEIATLSSNTSTVTSPPEPTNMPTANEKPITPPEEVTTIPPPMELPATSTPSESVKSSAANESTTTPTSEQVAPVSDKEAATIATPPVQKPTTAPPPAPPPLPPIAEPTATSTVVGSNISPTTPGSVSAENLLEMQQKLKKTLPRDTSLSKPGGVMHDIFDQFNDKISLMRSMVEQSDDEDYEELEWD